MECKVRRIPIPSVATFLHEAKNDDVRSALNQYFSNGVDVFIVYEVWRSSKIDMSSESGTDITASVGVKEMKQISKAEGKLIVKRTDKNALSIEADQPYAFAVKLLKLVKKPDGNIDLLATGFKPPQVTKSPDDQYTFATEEMQGITPKPVPRAERLAALQ